MTTNDIRVGQVWHGGLVRDIHVIVEMHRVPDHYSTQGYIEGCILEPVARNGSPPSFWKSLVGILQWQYLGTDIEEAMTNHIELFL